MVEQSELPIETGRPLTALVKYLETLGGHAALNNAVSAAFHTAKDDSFGYKKAREYYQKVCVQMMDVPAIQQERKQLKSIARYQSLKPQQYQAAVLWLQKQVEDFKGNVATRTKTSKISVVIDERGIYLESNPAKRYKNRGMRRQMIFDLLDALPNGLRAKNLAAHLEANRVSADIASINEIFRKNLQVSSDLIVHNGTGYTLNTKSFRIIAD
ncbi:MAG: hypothetical protein AAGA35_02135 [Patescibacteria group bacterium]